MSLSITQENKNGTNILTNLLKSTGLNLTYFITIMAPTEQLFLKYITGILISF